MTNSIPKVKRKKSNKPVKAVLPAPHRLELYKQHEWLPKRTLEIALCALGVALLVVGLVGTSHLLTYYSNRFYPGSSIDDQAVDSLTPEEVLASLQQQSAPPEYRVILKADQAELDSSSAQLGLHRDYQTAVQAGFMADQSQPLLTKLGRLLGLAPNENHQVAEWQYDTEILTSVLKDLEAKAATVAIEPNAQLKTSNNSASLVINPGKPGHQLDIPQALALVSQSIKPNETTTQSVDLSTALKNTSRVLTAEEVIAAKERATKLVGKNVAFKGDDQHLILTDKDLINFLTFPDGYSTQKLTELATKWNKTVTRPAQDAEFAYDPATLVVTTFQPGRNGLQLDQAKTEQQLTEALQATETTPDKTSFEYPLALAVAPPTQPLEKTNDLGINEVIGLGESRYAHSIPSRIHNVSLTSSRITNHIVKPGEEFSFNQTVGDVSQATGYQPAYVIKSGQTVLGDGGGVCQVSTTLFRALLDAGLNVTRRLPHSYRVSYYELNQKPGFDATVYDGNVDLRFINDSPNHVLIRSIADSKNLYMKVELYGTSDGRSTEIINYKSWDAKPAPPPVYTVDPTLPPGTVKQVDWATGGIKTEFVNVIKDKDGKVMSEDKYTSNYVPWSAKFLTGP